MWYVMWHIFRYTPAPQRSISQAGPFPRAAMRAFALAVLPVLARGHLPPGGASARRPEAAPYSGHQFKFADSFTMVNFDKLNKFNITDYYGMASVFVIASSTSTSVGPWSTVDVQPVPYRQCPVGLRCPHGCSSSHASVDTARSVCAAPVYAADPIRVLPQAF